MEIDKDKGLHYSCMGDSDGGGGGGKGGQRSSSLSHEDRNGGDGGGKWRRIKVLITHAWGCTDESSINKGRS